MPYQKQQKVFLLLQKNDNYEKNRDKRWWFAGKIILLDNEINHSL